MFANMQPLGFLTARKSESVEHLIGQTEEFVTALGPSQANLKPASEALNAAKALCAAQEYSLAVAQAKRAGRLAVKLNERFNAYMVAWKTLQACMEELQRLGFPSEALEVALGSADKEIVRPIEEDGAVVTNYLGARAILERAIGEARTVVAEARGASHEIFLATLAVEALSDSASDETPSWLAVRLEAMIEQATRELALGNVPAASKLASDARARAEDAHATCTEVEELLQSASAALERLGTVGRSGERLQARIRGARAAFDRGFLDRTSALVVARHLSRDASSFAMHYPRARSLLERAEHVYARLQRDDFVSYVVEVALSAARHALDAGDWAGVRDQVSRASQSFVRRRTEHEALAQAVAEIDQRVTLLKDFHLPLLPDVEEILGRAKDEVQTGRLSGANEDLLIANALMMQATRNTP